MKRKGKRILITALALVLVVGGIAGYLFLAKPFAKGDISGAADTVSITDRAIPYLPVDENGDFVLLQITDTHLYNATGKKDSRTLEELRKLVQAQQPDLVVATGDIFDGINPYLFWNKRAAVEALAELFEEENQYWAYVPGNNDGEYLGSARDVAAALSAYPRCILANEEGLTGATQFSMDIQTMAGETAYEKAGKTVHSLIFMDSLARQEKNRSKYDFMKADQAAWLAKTLDEKKLSNPNMKVSLFFHMPTPAMNAAQEQGEAYQEGYAPITDLWPAPPNEAVDEVITKAGNVGLVAIGHVHPPESWCSYYNQTYYHIARASGYEGAKEPGATRIIIHTAAADTRSMYDFEEILLGASSESRVPETTAKKEESLPTTETKPSEINSEPGMSEADWDMFAMARDISSDQFLLVEKNMTMQQVMATLGETTHIIGQGPSAMYYIVDGKPLKIDFENMDDVYPLDGRDMRMYFDAFGAVTPKTIFLEDVKRLKKGMTIQEIVAELGKTIDVGSGRHLVKYTIWHEMALSEFIFNSGGGEMPYSGEEIYDRIVNREGGETGVAW